MEDLQDYLNCFNMLKWIKRLLGTDKIERLEKENADLKVKLTEKQEHINKTNAYWKKQMYKTSPKKSN